SHASRTSQTLSLSCLAPLSSLHPFPTRRSSDLTSLTDFVTPDARRSHRSDIDELPNRRQFPPRLGQPHPVGGCQAREIAGAVVDRHAFGNEHVRFAFGLEGEDALACLVVSLPPCQQGAGQWRAAADGGAVARRGSRRCRAVRPLPGEPDDERREPFALGLTQRDAPAYPHGTVDVDVPG